MTSRKRRWYLGATLTATAAIGFAAAVLLTQPGCGSDCASNCPPDSVYIGTADYSVVPITNISYVGPACPPQYAITCYTDPSVLGCHHFTVTGLAEGYCDVTIMFSDRPAEIVRTEFGPKTTVGCCKGQTIVGATAFFIPTAADGGIYGADGGSPDAVTIVTEGGAGDGATDGGTDGAAD